MANPQRDPLEQGRRVVAAIKRQGLSIYDPIEIGDPELWLPSRELEAVLDHGLKGLSVEGYKIRTRSKVVKQAVCRTLGYLVPESFVKTQPRFPGQRFDTYVQKANNLQVWNEELDATRRYVVIRVSSSDRVDRVKVVTGDELVKLDRTGTLTQKYQAHVSLRAATTELVTPEDTTRLTALRKKQVREVRLSKSPLDYPDAEGLLSISELYERLCPVVGMRFPEAGYDQERNRGAALHRAACAVLGYGSYGDAGSFPDIPNQLLEVKLQTSTTIDLGLVPPNSTAPLDFPKLEGRQLRHCDVRYGVFVAKSDGKYVTVTHLFLSTGEGFFRRFQQFQGKIINKKLQIPLPADFFDR